MNKKYMKNTAILFASMTITKIVGAVFKIPLANILGGTGMGYFSTAYGLYSPVFALTAAGIPAVMMRLTAQNIAAGRPENALRTRRTALALFSVLGLAGTLVVALFSAFFAEHIACSPESTPAVIAISPAVMICCIASVLRGYHEGLSDVVPSAAAAVAEAVSRAAAGLALSYGVVFYAKYRFDNGLDVFGMQYADYSSAYAAALPYAAAGAIAAVSLSELCGLISLLISDRKRRTYPAPDSTPADRKRVIGFRLIREIIPVAASALVMNCVSFIDLLTVTRTLKASAEMNAVYFQREFSDILPAAGGLPGLANFMYGSYTGIAMTMFMLIPSFAGMTEKTSVPEIAAAWERKDENAAAQGCCTLFRAAAAIGFPACVGAAVLAEPLLSMLYRSRAAEVSACAGAFAVRRRSFHDNRFGYVRSVPGYRKGTYPAYSHVLRCCSQGFAESAADINSSAEYLRRRCFHRRGLHRDVCRRVADSTKKTRWKDQCFRLREASAVLLAALRSFRRACVPGGEKRAAIASERHYSRVCRRYCLWNITNFNIGFS